MAFTTSQEQFNGILDETSVVELNSKIDYKKTKLKERKKVIEDILNETSFYEEYFDEYFKPNITSNQSLSSNNNVCRSLERMANYLLNSKEIKEEEDREKQQYVFHKDENYFKKKLRREISIEKMGNGNPENEENVIHFLIRNEENYKKSKNQNISFDNLKPSITNSKEDIEELQRIMGEYKQFHDFITEKIVDKDRKENRYLLTTIKGQLIDDMIICKDQLLGIFGYELKNGQPEKPRPDLLFDFTNETHLKGRTLYFEDSGTTVFAKGLIFFNPTNDYTDDFNIVLLDLQKTISKAKLTDEEKKVLKMCQTGYSQDEIADQLNTYKMRVSRIIDRIVRKIVKVGDKYSQVEAF